MTGVEILAAEEVAIAFGFSWSAFWIAYVISAFVLGLLAFIVFSADRRTMDDNRFNVNAAIITGLLCGILPGIMCGEVFQNPTDYETQYKITIDDSVSMNEFNEKYEIIDQEGKIYTVREKSNNN